MRAMKQIVEALVQDELRSLQEQKQSSFLPKKPPTPNLAERVTLDFKEGGSDSNWNIQSPYSIEYFKKIAPAMKLLRSNGIDIRVSYVDPRTGQVSSKAKHGVLQKARLSGVKKSFKKVLAQLDKLSNDEVMADAFNALTKTYNHSAWTI
jgi:hypothetical protein